MGLQCSSTSTAPSITALANSQKVGVSPSPLSHSDLKLSNLCRRHNQLSAESGNVLITTKNESNPVLLYAKAGCCNYCITAEPQAEDYNKAQFDNCVGSILSAHQCFTSLTLQNT